MSYQLEKSIRCFAGQIETYAHKSKSTKTTMRFSLYRPDKIKSNKLLIWLSGLTCNQDNFQIKAGASETLAEKGIVLVCPDTSPRGLGIAGEHDNYDFGEGAGFYLNATKGPWAENYQMESYITSDLIEVLQELVDYSSIGLFGHSMGGHGALTLGLKYAELFSSISAFSPILAPTKCPWGQKAFAGYLKDPADGNKYDFMNLLKQVQSHVPLLIDQGLDDEFLKEQLGMNYLEEYLAKNSSAPITLRKQTGFDHSYFFISSFIKDHINFHMG